jgi:predicted NAD/FAD-binding protein
VFRDSAGVSVVTQQFGAQRFDAVVFATHSDQALALLRDASGPERSVLEAFGYRGNEVVLHTDASLLPRRQRAWSSWNYRLNNAVDAGASVTYNMNILQNLTAPVTFCVTLNDSAAIAPDKILRKFNYSHPVFNLDSIGAQSRWSEINGVNRSWFCGAYWRNGFHEDGVVSALRVCRALGVEF